MKISRNWLQTFFDAKLPDTEKIAHTFTFGAFEIESIESVGEDTVIDVKILPNRAHDCLSHRGIARELGSLLALPLSRDPLAKEMPDFQSVEKVQLRVDDTNANPVHALALITGVTVGPSPEWLRIRLETLGQRSINNVVDATNYVMLDMGQPTHAFDWDKLQEKNGVRGIHVRSVAVDEKITLLGGQEKVLHTGVQVLSDFVSGVALDIAGVKGGTVAELTKDTKNVLITSAKFNPTQIRRTAQKLKIRTDASHRFENEVADVLPFHGIREVTELIVAIAGGTVVTQVAQGDPKLVYPHVQTTVARINAVLGFSLTEDRVSNIFQQLGFTFTFHEGVFSVTPPLERLDLVIEEDLIEEVGRVHGYETLPETPLPKIATEPQLDPMFFLKDVVRESLNTLGYTEVLSYSLRDTGTLQLANALASDKGFLRDSLAPALRIALSENETRTAFIAEYSALRIFEIGNVFTKDGEYTHLCIAVRPLGMKKRAERTVQFLKEAEDAVMSALGVATLDWVRSEETSEISLTTLVSGIKSNTYNLIPHVQGGLMYAPLSPYPFVQRDIAFWAPSGVNEIEIRNMLRELAGPLLIRIDLFDSFTKDGKTSYAYHLILQSHEKTLVEEEITTVMTRITGEIEKKGYTVR